MLSIINRAFISIKMFFLKYRIRKKLMAKLIHMYKVKKNKLQMLNHHFKKKDIVYSKY